MLQAQESKIVGEVEGQEVDRELAEQAPEELKPELLRLIGGGTGAESSPGRNW